MMKTLKIHSKDNVWVCLEGQENQVGQEGFLLGHKYASQEIQQGEPVIKYGMPIGVATQNIGVNEHVHTHNLRTQLGSTQSEYVYQPMTHTIERTMTEMEKVEIETKGHAQLHETKHVKLENTVQVYPRANNQVGIRNELWIIPTVGCVNGVAQQIIKAFNQQYDLANREVPNFDGLHTFPHPYGCSQMGEDHVTTRMSLQNIVKHPNAGGVLVLGLGCENNQIQQFKETLGTYDTNRVDFLVCQEAEDEVAEGVRLLTQLFEQMQSDHRVSAPISVLNIGLECGGSDGFSGITANPLIGKFSDDLIGQGGTTVLTEVPEMFGAETILMNRCMNEVVFQKTVTMVQNFKDYYTRHHQVIYENPSPGNKKGGISTLEDKSLGCTTKAGDAQVMDVLALTDTLKVKGLNLLSAPGNDGVATTALGMCGCHLVLFSTGRGTPFGGFVPTFKIATNSALFQKKTNWMDFNAGRLLEGVPMAELEAQLMHDIIETVNGKKTKQEINDHREIAIFKSGVTL